MTDEYPLYALSEEHRAIREAVRAVCDAKVAPYAAAVDEEARYPEEAAEALRASDFHAPHVPEEYGGAGADALATCREVVTGADFYRPAHETTWDAMTRLAEAGEAVDAITAALAYLSARFGRTWTR